MAGKVNDNREPPDVHRHFVIPTHSPKISKPLQINMFKSGSGYEKNCNHCLQNVIFKEALPIFGVNLIMVKFLGFKTMKQWLIPFSNTGLALMLGHTNCHSRHPQANIKENLANK